MKLSGKWKLKKIGNDSILMPIGQNALDLRRVINLNSTSLELYEQLSLGKNEEELVSYLLANYDVSKEEASKDVHEFIIKLKESKVLIDD